MQKRGIILASLIFLFVGCTGTDEIVDTIVDQNEEMEQVEEAKTPEESPTEEVEETEADVTLTVMAKNLNIPWAITKVDDIFYITEREGNIVKIEDGEMERQEVKLAELLSTVAEAGLLGFVLHPNYTENKQAIAYYTYDGSDGPTNRIVELVQTDNEWMESEVLLDGIPSGRVHHGGRLAIGPDDKLYATTGDAFESGLAQDQNSLAGKILRLNLDGSLPDDNPFEESYVYSLGHRNAQGITWLSDETMYASEHGNQAHDEINRIEAGQNYGWPLIEGTEARDDLISPIFTSGAEETWAPSGMAADDNKLYMAGLRGHAVYTLDLDTQKFGSLLTDFGRIRDVYIEDGYLYLITNNTDGRGHPDDEDDRFMRIGLSELP